MSKENFELAKRMNEEILEGARLTAPEDLSWRDFSENFKGALRVFGFEGEFPSVFVTGNPRIAEDAEGGESQMFMGFRVSDTNQSNLYDLVIGGLDMDALSWLQRRMLAVLCAWEYVQFAEGKKELTGPLSLSEIFKVGGTSALLSLRGMFKEITSGFFSRQLL